MQVGRSYQQLSERLLFNGHENIMKFKTIMLNNKTNWSNLAIEPDK